MRHSIFASHPRLPLVARTRLLCVSVCCRVELNLPLSGLSSYVCVRGQIISFRHCASSGSDTRLDHIRTNRMP